MDIDFENSIGRLNFIAVYTIHQNCLDKSLNTTAELVIPIGISTKEAQAEPETHPVNAEAKISRC